MNQQFVTSLNLTYIPTHSNNPFGHWIMTDESGHITTGGMLSSYEEGLDMLTIRGAGHMVPTDKPKEALQMIYNFINKLDYSTPFPDSEHCTN
ncbi:hypothetical protein WR25_13877 [Diploscapter pachys]|uniref:Uncharacterized protein n=1 Tax=Diploscapter pachys TaxID=2018661 RepID=A0A2A2L786_9BILA|nr:hypothetical protein WR25_13877 [Diploscapter pachys]